MEYIFERTINYYETDRMGIVHHSNYIRFLEEARCKFLDDIGLPYLSFENNQIMIEEINKNWNLGELKYPFGNGINISMSVKDVEKIYNDLKEKNIKFFLKLEVHKYRVDNEIYEDKEFLIQDPDGYLLRFNN